MIKFLLKKTFLIVTLTTLVAHVSKSNVIAAKVPQISLKSQKQEIKFEHSFASWKSACRALPAYSPNDVRAQFKNVKNILSAEELSKALNLYFKALNDDKELFLNKKNWIHQELPELLIKSIQNENAGPLFDPFVEKIVLKDKSIVAFHGDIHGDVHSLISFIDNLQHRGFLKDFEIKNPNFYMVFLGDYTDRGLYGPEVIYSILRLKIANPHKVFLVRGNHEDSTQNKSDKEDRYYHECFWSQLETIFNKKSAEELFEKINKFYESMPLALYLGCKAKNQIDYILCCHGGIEFGFDPLPLLNHGSDHAFTQLGVVDRWNQLQKLDEQENESILNLFKKAHTSINSLKDLLLAMNYYNVMYDPLIKAFEPRSLVTPKYFHSYRHELGLLIGFQWNDYIVDASVEHERWPCFIKHSLGRGFAIGKTFNDAMLQLSSDKKNKVRGVFRAHQHMAHPEDPMMRRILNKDNLDYAINKGVGKLWISQTSKPDSAYKVWDNIVCTFNVSPNTIYQVAGFKEDTYGLLTLAYGYEDWRLEVINQKTVQ